MGQGLLDRHLDRSLAFLRDPYRFISRRASRLGQDVFQTRLLLRPTLCMTGREAAEVFYDPERFVRQGAAPGRVQKTLFGKGGVQGMDGAAHRHRKAMFLTLTGHEAASRLLEITAAGWRGAAERWSAMGRVVLYDEFLELLTRAVCQWAGVPMPEQDVGHRMRELTALFDSAGAVGPRHWRSRAARKRANQWAGKMVLRVRADPSAYPPGSAVRVIAAHREPNGELLDQHAAGVALLNILRPTVAVAVYMTFVAHAQHVHSAAAEELRAGDDAAAERFVQEVRRLYPFFPAVMARVREDFTWHGHRFDRGMAAALDLYGINHDARVWDEPETFRPGRFMDGAATEPYGFVPQGGGDAAAGHRCPGEDVAVALMKQTAVMLTQHLRYEVPAQDLRIDMARLPALPRSRMVIERVR